MLWMDSQRIGQVLLNLLSNAVKFTPVGGRVTVQLRCEEEIVRCEIMDSGAGIPEQDLPKLFQRFSQLEDGRRLGQGTGLGLSISKALIEAHGGTIGVHSRSGSGSTFYFWLPMAQPSVLLPEAEAVVRADQPATLVVSDGDGA
ncbi:Sensor histidine kinase YycG [compost metagenome]